MVTIVIDYDKDRMIKNIQENKYYKLLISYFQAQYNMSSKRFYNTMSDIEQLLAIYNLLPSALGA